MYPTVYPTQETNAFLFPEIFRIRCVSNRGMPFTLCWHLNSADQRGLERQPRPGPSGRVHTRSTCLGTAPPLGGPGPRSRTGPCELGVAPLAAFSQRAWARGEPLSARRHSLRLGKKNSPKDFAAVAGCLWVTHLLILIKTGNSVYSKPMHLPESPTLALQINK